MTEDYWSDERLFEKIKKMGLNSREAFYFIGINPENFEKLNNKDPELEKKWIYNTKEMIKYYSFGQIYSLLNEIISLSSEEQYSQNKNFLNLINRFNPEQKKFYKYYKSLGLNFEQVIENYNLKLIKDRCKCPFHEGDNPTSLNIDFKKQRFRCWSCGLRGNLIQFIQMMEDKYGN